MNTHFVTATVLLVTLCGLWASPAGADWSVDPDDNNPVCTAAQFQQYPQMISDGEGGAIIAWVDSRNEAADIYVQRIDDLGGALWDADGVPVCTAHDTQTGVQLVGDGTGGAILVWEDYRDSEFADIYAQRVGRDGEVVWATNGVPIAREDSYQWSPRLIGDGSGGAIFCWEDYRSSSWDIYAQRLNASGVRQWASGGVLVCGDPNQQQGSQLVGDGAGGAIIGWHDGRAGAGLTDIYAQRVDGDGTAQWVVDGVVICGAGNTQYYPELAADGSGGAFIVWRDLRSATSYDIYIQRVEGDGSMGFATDGAAVSTATGDQQDYRVENDGDGGAIITWYDRRAGIGESDIYAQRVLANGTMLWTADGAAVCTANDNQGSPDLVVNAAGEAVIAWHDSRGTDYDIYAQLLDTDGNPKWTVNGVAVSTAASSQSAPVLADSADGRVIIAWQDYRSETDRDIYAQLIERNGYLGNPGPAVTEVVDNPDDQGGLVVLSWAPSYLDAYPRQLVTHYSVWRRVPPARSGETDPDRSGWVHAEDVPAIYWDEYGSVAPTFGIYPGSGSPEMTEYKVVAHTADQWAYWESAVDSGYSTDNLAPGAPLDLTGTPSDTDVALSWSASGSHDEDLAFYNVYRGDNPGFHPGQDTFIGTAADPAYTDTAPGAGTWYYLVTAEDVHGNEGPVSNETSAATAPSATLAATLSCQPSSGVVPFVTQLSVIMENFYAGQVRRFAAHIDLLLAGGVSYTNWRAGYTNVAAGDSFTTSWNQDIPALGALIGDNVFSLVAEDVTPAPYNQPPYPPSGDTAADGCRVTAMAP